jgi:membrane-associated protein
MLEFFLHLDQHLREIVLQYGTWTYLILFAIIFAETGLVIFPFLPGDSLLFGAGVISQQDIGLDVKLLFLVFTSASILGDSTNYVIGKYFGRRLFKNPKSKIFKQQNLDRTHAFFEKYGANTIIFARFVPIVRTFAPFVAGLGAMEYRKFVLYSVAGSFLWVGVCLFAGFFFGQIPIVRDNFAIAILVIVAATVIPAALEIWRHRRKAKKQATAEQVE